MAELDLGLACAAKGLELAVVKSITLFLRNPALPLCRQVSQRARSKACDTGCAKSGIVLCVLLVREEALDHSDGGVLAGVFIPVSS